MMQSVPRVAVRRHQRHAEIEPDARLAGYQRIVGEARIERGVRYQKSPARLRMVWAQKPSSRGISVFSTPICDLNHRRSRSTKHTKAWARGDKRGKARDIAVTQLRQRNENTERCR